MSISRDGAAPGAIVGASTHALRRDLVLRLEDAGYGSSSLAGDPDELDEAIAAATRAPWVLTGGPVALASPFLRTALAREVPVIALVRGDRSGLRALIAPQAAALLGDEGDTARLRASVAAVNAGLSVWQPEESSIDREFEPLRFGAGPLSARELDVLEGVAAGLTNKRIARQLSLSPNTVKFHLQAAFDKLGVRSRAEAVAVALRRGEITV